MLPHPLRAFLLSVLGLGACARPSAPPPPDVREAWARETLAGMGLAEKVGQMIFARSDGIFLHEGEPAFRELLEAAREGRIGGVVFFRGDPYSTAALGNRLQEVARLPLLMASDYEWGTAFRVEGGIRFPSAMAVAAGGSEEDARLQGEVTAREARALGVHLALAPVVDLNLNQANSVINYRSFGQDAEEVSRLAAAFIRGAQEGGLLATAKHFPGHGAAELDSHLALPVIRLDRSQIEIELSPFRAAVEAGVAAVMTAHVAVPALDGREDRPATFSPEILEGLLRGRMGFRGLILSDALDMQGARESWWGGEAAVAAVKAGCDILLVPPHPRLAWDAVRRAVERGEIPSERIDRSVARILDAKVRFKLHRQRTVSLLDLPRLVGDPGVKEKVQAIADRSITLVAHREAVLPLRAERPLRLLLVSYVLEGDRAVDPAVLASEITARAEGVTHLALSSASARARLAELSDLAGRADLVLVASFARTRSGEGRGEILPELSGAIREIASSRKPVLLLALGNPYVLTELPEAAALLAAYDFSVPSQKAAARALFGEMNVRGKLPVHLSAVYPLGHGLQLKRRSMELEKADRVEEAGFSQDKLARAMRLLEEAVKAKAFPGAVALVGRRGKIVAERAFGRFGYHPDSPRVTPETIYDVASLTKVVATTTAAMILFERGELIPEKPVVDYIPEFTGGDRARVTIADLLAHSSGLAWWKDFYKEYGHLGAAEAKKNYLQAICRLPLDYPPRSKTAYSDLGFILLGEVLERASARSLEEFTRKEIFEPLGMTETLYNPPASLHVRIAPTEIDPWRGRLLRGEVHDENAFALGGVASHAGLFSTGSDLARFAQMLLNGGTYGAGRILKRSTVSRFTRRAGLVTGSSRALGWDTPSAGGSSGRYFSGSSFGHTGFTGTSLWIDPERELFVILLTNRVHPSRDNPQIQDIRPRFHDAVMEAATDIPLAPREP